MASIASGLNFSTLSEEGINLALVSTYNSATPEYPALPFALGTVTIGLDGSKWIFVKPAAIYALGTVGAFDTSWNFTALTTSNATNLGYTVGVMSQVANVTTPTATTWDGVWVQIAGLCPAISVVASTTNLVQLYTSATAGALSSSSAGSAVAINGVVISSAQGSGGAGTQAGVLNSPEISLTT